MNFYGDLVDLKNKFFSFRVELPWYERAKISFFVFYFKIFFIIKIAHTKRHGNGSVPKFERFTVFLNEFNYSS